MIIEVCVECEREYRILETGAYVVRKRSSGEPFEIWKADIWRCPSCGNEITTGYGKEAVSYSSERDFEDILNSIYEHGSSHGSSIVEVQY